MPYDNAFDRGNHYWSSPLPSPEARAREAMKFVRVSLNDGHLTDISISMLLVELKRNGLRIADTRGGAT